MRIVDFTAGHLRALWRVVLGLVFAACAIAPLGGRTLDANSAARPASPREWPHTWQGKAPRPSALSEVEQRFADRFPGRIVRATDGENVLVFRDVATPTRVLHPAADCCGGRGYRIVDARLEADARSALWRCFEAERDGRRVRVCERIVDANSASFTDASSGFRAARLGQSSGPWQAITVARPM